MSDIERLKAKHPLWLVGSAWASAASGPDRRQLWATRDGVQVHAWSAEALSERITAEERRNNWVAPERPPFAG